MKIQILPIDWKNKEICIQFRTDSFICSFGDANLFDRVEYLDWLKNIIDKNPLSALHVWEEDKIIGQLELNVREGFGYVNLFYLIPEKRGSGIAEILNSYVEEYYKKLGISKIRLTVSLENKRAIAYYLKHSWKVIGPRSDFPGTQFMEKILFKSE